MAPKDFEVADSLEHMTREEYIIHKCQQLDRFYDYHEKLAAGSHEKFPEEISLEDWETQYALWNRKDYVNE